MGMFPLLSLDSQAFTNGEYVVIQECGNYHLPLQEAQGLLNGGFTLVINGVNFNEHWIQ